MGVDAPMGVTKFYYFAYWVGLFVAAATYWVLCKLFPPAIMYNEGWMEVKNYVRPEEEAQVLEGQGMDVEASSVGQGEKEVAREVVTDLKG